MTEEENKLITQLQTHESRVLYLLENYPPTRNNDFYLQLLYMKYFLGIQIPFLDWHKIRDASGELESISRMRRKIQNEKGLWPPTDPRVFLARQKREQAYRKVMPRL